MGYSHGRKWDETKIEQSIREVMDKAKIDTMPTRPIIREVTNNEALVNAISRHGGFAYWAEKLGLETKKSESKFGYEYECKCVDILVNKFGYNCELMKKKYPYDILVNSNIKIDVKVCNIDNCNAVCKFYTFNLEKKNPTCDIYVCFCVENEEIAKVYVIPSCVMSGKTQLSVGINRSKYDKYIDDWNVVSAYDYFYQSLLIQE